MAASVDEFGVPSISDGEEKPVIKEEVTAGVVNNGDGGNDEDGEKQTANGGASEKRRTRKVQLGSLAENSDGSLDSDDEPVRPVKRKARTSGKMSSSRNSDIKRPVSKPKRGRGRPKGSTKKKATPTKGRGRPKAVVQKEEEEEEDDDDDEDDNNIMDEDEEFVPPKKSPRQSLSGGRGRGRGRGRPAAKASRAEEEEEEEEEEDEEEEEEEEEDLEADEDENSGAMENFVNEDFDPNSPEMRTGQFMIEKVDLKRLENYPIWRMEGPNMLRKFEMIASDGKIQHKSLYAYSSWAQSMVDQYKKILVSQVSSHDGETIVEVKKEFVPMQPSLESLELYSSDALFDSYCTLVQALFNQAIDNGFLAKIKDSNEPRYINQIATVDAAVMGHVEKIEALVNMKDEFKTRVKNCPNMKSIKRQNWTQADQATVDRTAEKGVRSVLMFGYGYDPFLMVEDKSRGVEVAQEIVVGNTMERYLTPYHGLFHFKFSMLQRCMDKMRIVKGIDSSLTDEQALQKCMDDRIWLLQTFEDLKVLMNYEQPHPISGHEQQHNMAQGQHMLQEQQHAVQEQQHAVQNPQHVGQLQHMSYT